MIYIKNKGYISIEIIIIGAVIMAFGLFAANRFINGGQNVSDKQYAAFKDTSNTIYQGVGSGSIIPGGGGLPGGGMKPSTLGLKPNDMITIEGRKYVVLEDKNSNQYLVMDVDGIGKREFNTDRNGQDPNKCGYINGSWKNETCNNQYENSNIDYYLNGDYYSSLSFKDAIVEQDIQQNFYSHTWSNPNYRWGDSNNPLNPGNCTGACVKQPDGKWIPWYEHTPIKGEPGDLKFTNKGSKRQDDYQAPTIKRKVFLPSINEISSVVNINDQWEMDTFLRNSFGNYLHMWLRNSRFENSSSAVHGGYNFRSLYSNHVRSIYISARPAFVIDLTKVKFSKDNKVFIPAYSPEESKAKYEVHHYWQNITDDNYTLHEKVPYETKGNSKVLMEQLKKDYQGFNYINSKVGNDIVTEITIKPNGTTVVDMYYDRKLYYLDLNGIIDGTRKKNLGDCGTVSIKVNDKIVDQNCSDYYTKHRYGSTYEFFDIKASDGCSYIGLANNSRPLKGTILGPGITVISLAFETKK